MMMASSDPYALSYINNKLSKDSAGCSNENHKNFFISVVFYDYFIVMAGCNSAEGESEVRRKKKLLHQSYEYLIVFFSRFGASLSKKAKLNISFYTKNKKMA
jgi:hypothetical protein